MATAKRASSSLVMPQTFTNMPVERYSRVAGGRAIGSAALATTSAEELADHPTGVVGRHERLADEDRVVAGIAQRPRVVAVTHA